jgi:hypothetical protein
MYRSVPGRRSLLSKTIDKSPPKIRRIGTIGKNGGIGLAVSLGTFLPLLASSHHRQSPVESDNHFPVRYDRPSPARSIFGCARRSSFDLESRSRVSGLAARREPGARRILLSSDARRPRMNVSVREIAFRRHCPNRPSLVAADPGRPSLYKPQPWRPWRPPRDALCMPTAG